MRKENVGNQVPTRKVKRKKMNEIFHRKKVSEKSEE